MDQPFARNPSRRSLTPPPPYTRLDLLLESIAYGLLHHYGVSRPPVPVFKMLEQPPPGMEHDLDVCFVLPFGDASFVRLLDGQGVVFVNPNVAPAYQRYSAAREMIRGVLTSRRGEALGFRRLSLQYPVAAAEYFARCLLLPASFLKSRPPTLSQAQLVEEYEVPLEVAAMRLSELNGAPRDLGHERPQ